MGNFISPVADRATVIAAPRLWIEGAAIQQLAKTVQLPGMVRAVGMPDLHPGRGYPIGASFFTQGRFYPALVGGDIGCGVSVWTTTLPAAKVKLDKLDRLIGNIDSPLLADELERIHDAFPDIDGKIAQVELALANAGLDVGFMRTLGTQGSGNHFCELQRLERIIGASDVAPDLLGARHLTLVVHSGSRGLGTAILREHVERFGHGGIEASTPEALDYIRRHDAAVAFAELNRRLIALRVLLRLGAQGSLRLDVNHNTVTPAHFDEIDGWVHRKGATPMAGELVLIPGSRDHLSFLVKPIATAMQASLKIGGSRSQSSNKAAALALLDAKLREHIDRASGEDRAQRRLRHCSRAGQPVAKRFMDSDFRLEN